MGGINISFEQKLMNYLKCDMILSDDCVNVDMIEGFFAPQQLMQEWAMRGWNQIDVRHCCPVCAQTLYTNTQYTNQTQEETKNE